MNNTKLELKEIYFTQQTADLFSDTKGVDTSIINVAFKLIQESRATLTTLGEFAAIIIDDDDYGTYEESRELYHPSQFSDLEYDLFMFEEMLSHMKENEENPNFIVGVFPKDEEKHVLAFYTGREN